MASSLSGNGSIELRVLDRRENFGEARAGPESRGDQVVAADQRRGTSGPGRQRGQPFAGVVVEIEIPVAGKAVKAMQRQMFLETRAGGRSA